MIRNSMEPGAVISKVMSFITVFIFFDFRILNIPKEALNQVLCT